MRPIMTTRTDPLPIESPSVRSFGAGRSSFIRFPERGRPLVRARRPPGRVAFSIKYFCVPFGSASKLALVPKKRRIKVLSCREKAVG